MHAIDQLGRYVVLFVGDGGFFILGQNQFSSGLAQFDSTDSFHRYRLVVNSSGASVCVDGATAPAVSLEIFKFRTLERSDEAEFGDSTVNLSSNTAFKNFSISTSGSCDSDGDGCSDKRENGPDETQGGQRDWQNPNDFYDVAGSPGPPQNGAPDGVVDLPNDILGVIQHHPAGTLGYDVQFDRGPWTGPNSWNDTQGPDGVIDLPNDILGVILQFNHRCV